MTRVRNSSVDISNEMRCSRASYTKHSISHPAEQQHAKVVMHDEAYNVLVLCSERCLLLIHHLEVVHGSQRSRFNWHLTVITVIAAAFQYFHAKTNISCAPVIILDQERIYRASSLPTKVSRMSLQRVHLGQELFKATRQLEHLLVQILCQPRIHPHIAGQFSQH